MPHGVVDFWNVMTHGVVDFWNVMPHGVVDLQPPSLRGIMCTNEHTGHRFLPDTGACHKTTSHKTTMLTFTVT
jgi:hypothetical protein